MALPLLRRRPRRDTAPPPGPTTDVPRQRKPEKPAKETAAKVTPRAADKSAAKSAANSAPVTPQPLQQLRSAAPMAPRRAATPTHCEELQPATAGKLRQRIPPNAAAKLPRKGIRRRTTGPDRRRCRPMPSQPRRKCCPAQLIRRQRKNPGARMKSAHDQAAEMGPASDSGTDARRTTFPDARAGTQDRPDRDRRRDTAATTRARSGRPA